MRSFEFLAILAAYPMYDRYPYGEAVLGDGWIPSSYSIFETNWVGIRRIGAGL